MRAPFYLPEENIWTKEEDLHQTSWMDNQFDRDSGTGQIINNSNINGSKQFPVPISGNSDHTQCLRYFAQSVQEIPRKLPWIRTSRFYILSDPHSCSHQTSQRWELRNARLACRTVGFPQHVARSMPTRYKKTGANSSAWRLITKPDIRDVTVRVALWLLHSCCLKCTWPVYVMLHTSLFKMLRCRESLHSPVTSHAQSVVGSLSVISFKTPLEPNKAPVHRR